MKTLIGNPKCFMFIVVILLVGFGMQASYGQTITASTPRPLTGATLHESVVTLTLSGGIYERARWNIADALTVSGINDVTIGTFGPAWFGVDRINDTQITVELGFTGNLNTDATLTFTVGAGAIANYNGPALTAQIPVAAGGESSETDNNPAPNVDVSVTTGGEDDKIDGQPPTTGTPAQTSGGQSVSLTASPHRAQAELNGSVVTLTLSGGTYVRSIFDIRGTVTVSGISGVTVPRHQPGRKSDTEITVELDFTGNLNTDAILTFTVGAGAIANYNGPALTAQIPVVTLIAQEIRGPWLWMVVPTDSTAGAGISTEIDALAAASGGAITEAHLAQNGTNEGAILGQQRWTSSIAHSKRVCKTYNIWFCPDPTVCWENNINTVVSTLGMGSGANTNGDTAYALINLYSPHQQSDVLLTVKSGDAIKVWLNGDVVHRDDAENYNCREIDVPLACDPWVCVSDPAVQESDVHSVAITLNHGNNLLLVKVRQHGEYWGMNVGLAADFTTSIDTRKSPTNSGDTTPIAADVNQDGKVDIRDLILVIKALGDTVPTNPRVDVNGDGNVDKSDLLLIVENLDDSAIPAAPASRAMLSTLSPVTLQAWINMLHTESDGSITYRKTLAILQMLLETVLPHESALLPNYPNPFNPETWIPYHLANDTDVSLFIYDMDGVLVRQLDLGHQRAGYYTDRSRAAYWDGRNAWGERVASGVYFYQLRAGDYLQMRKMVILK